MLIEIIRYNRAVKYMESIGSDKVSLQSAVYWTVETYRFSVVERSQFYLCVCVSQNGLTHH